MREPILSIGMIGWGLRRRTQIIALRASDLSADGLECVDAVALRTGLTATGTPALEAARRRTWLGSVDIHRSQIIAAAR